MHISIPELDERNLTSEEFFRIIYIMLVHKINYLMEIHPSKAINNIDGYSLQLARRIADSAYTLHYVIEELEDYVVAFSIVRSLADMLASFILIYGNEDKEEKYLRHYLYILDGMEGRLSMLPEEVENDGKLKNEEYDGLCKQIDNAKVNYSRAKDFCIHQIRELKLYIDKKQSIETLIKKRNWKYQNIDTPENHYSWKQMYNLIDMKLDGKFVSSLSDFVHGLSTSLLIVDIDETTFEPVYGVATSLLGKLRKRLYTIFIKDMHSVRQHMLSVLADPAMPKQYVNYILEQVKEK